MKKILRLFVSAMVVMSLLAGCGGNSTNNGGTKGSQTAPETIEVSMPENAQDSSVNSNEIKWPRTYIDALGNEVTLEKQPELVVSAFHAMFPDYFYAFDVHPLAVAAAESRFNHLSAYEKFLNQQKPEDIGATNALNFEKILSLSPDVIIMTKLQEEVYPQLSQIATTIVLDHAKINADWRYGVEEFGKIFGQEEKVADIIADVEGSIAEGAESLEEFRAKKETVVFIAITGKQIFPYAVTQLKTVYNRVDDDGLGLTAPEAYTKLTDYSQPLSLEVLATDYDPDHIFVVADNVDGDAKEYINQLETSTLWQNMKAVKNNHVYQIDRSIFGFNAPIATQFGVSYVVDKLTK